MFIKNVHKKFSISYQQRSHHRGYHSPAEINLLGRLGYMIISISIRANSDSHKWVRTEAYY